MKNLSGFLFLIFIFLVSSSLCLGQNKKPAPSSVDPGSSFYNSSVTSKSSSKSKSARQKKNKAKSPNVYYDQKLREFEKRMEKNAKASLKRERKMKKPQYSDPMYFGHKRPPKKRKQGKRKFCKECGIVH